MRGRWLTASALMVLVVLGFVPASSGATAAAAARPAGQQVVLLLVPRSSWEDLPDRFDGWAKASMAIATANGARRESDVYLTISKGGRSSGFGARVGTGPMSLDGNRLTFLDWDDFVEHDKELRYGGDIGTLGQHTRDAGLRTVAITRSNTMSAMVLADRDGVVEHVVPGGGAIDVATEVRKGTDLVVAETPADALPLVLDGVGDTCTVVASSSMPLDQRALGALAISPRCGLGTGRLVSATTRQADYTVVADLLPTLLELLGLDSDVDDEASVIQPVRGTRTVQELVDRSDRARVTGRSSGYFNALGVVAVLLGLFATQMSDRWRRRWAACLLALPGSILLIELVSWWRLGVAGGLGLALATAVVLGVAASTLFASRPRLLVGTLALGTAVLLGVDASTGGHLQFDSGIANNAIGAGRFSGMGNIPYGFLIAACLLTAGIALERWGRRAVAPLAIGLAAAVVADGAPTLGADVGGVLAAVPAFAFLLFAWRRPLPLRRLALLGVSGVAVLSAFAAFDVSRPAANRTHLGRTLTNGDLLPTIIRREMAALQSFQRSTWCVVLLVVLVGLAVMWEQLPTTRPLQVMLGALGVAAVLGTFVNDSGVSVAGAMAAVAWPALVILLRPAPISEDEPGDTAPRRPPRRSSGSAAARSAR